MASPATISTPPNPSNLGNGEIPPPPPPPPPLNFSKKTTGKDPFGSMILDSSIAQSLESEQALGDLNAEILQQGKKLKPVAERVTSPEPFQNGSKPSDELFAHLKEAALARIKRLKKPLSKKVMTFSTKGKEEAEELGNSRKKNLGNTKSFSPSTFLKKESLIEVMQAFKDTQFPDEILEAVEILIKNTEIHGLLKEKIDSNSNWEEVLSNTKIDIENREKLNKMPIDDAPIWLNLFKKHEHAIKTREVGGRTFFEEIRSARKQKTFSFKIELGELQNIKDTLKKPKKREKKSTNEDYQGSLFLKQIKNINTKPKEINKNVIARLRTFLNKAENSKISKENKIIDLLINYRKEDLKELLQIIRIPKEEIESFEPQVNSPWKKTYIEWRGLAQTFFLIEIALCRLTGEKYQQQEGSVDSSSIWVKKTEEQLKAIEEENKQFKEHRELGKICYKKISNRTKESLGEERSKLIEHNESIFSLSLSEKREAKSKEKAEEGNAPSLEYIISNKKLYALLDFIIGEISEVSGLIKKIQRNIPVENRTEDFTVDKNKENIKSSNLVLINKKLDELIKYKQLVVKEVISRNSNEIDFRLKKENERIDLIKEISDGMNIYLLKIKPNIDLFELNIKNLSEKELKNLSSYFLYSLKNEIGDTLSDDEMNEQINNPSNWTNYYKKVMDEITSREKEQQIINDGKNLYENVLEEVKKSDTNPDLKEIFNLFGQQIQKRNLDEITSIYTYLSFLNLNPDASYLLLKHQKIVKKEIRAKNDSNYEKKLRDQEFAKIINKALGFCEQKDTKKGDKLYQELLNNACPGCEGIQQEELQNKEDAIFFITFLIESETTPRLKSIQTFLDNRCKQLQSENIYSGPEFDHVKLIVGEIKARKSPESLSEHRRKNACLLRDRLELARGKEKYERMATAAFFIIQQREAENFLEKETPPTIEDIIQDPLSAALRGCGSRELDCLRRYVETQVKPIKHQAPHWRADADEGKRSPLEDDLGNSFIGSPTGIYKGMTAWQSIELAVTRELDTQNDKEEREKRQKLETERLEDAQMLYEGRQVFNSCDKENPNLDTLGTESIQNLYYYLQYYIQKNPAQIGQKNEELNVIQSLYTQVFNQMKRVDSGKRLEVCLKPTSSNAGTDDTGDSNTVNLTEEASQVWRIPNPLNFLFYQTPSETSGGLEKHLSKV